MQKYRKQTVKTDFFINIPSILLWSGKAMKYQKLKLSNTVQKRSTRIQTIEQTYKQHTISVNQLIAASYLFCDFLTIE